MLTRLWAQFEFGDRGEKTCGEKVFQFIHGEWSELKWRSNKQPISQSRFSAQATQNTKCKLMLLKFVLNYECVLLSYFIVATIAYIPVWSVVHLSTKPAKIMTHETPLGKLDLETKAVKFAVLQTVANTWRSGLFSVCLVRNMCHNRPNFTSKK